MPATPDPDRPGDPQPHSPAAGQRPLKAPASVGKAPLSPGDPHPGAGSGLPQPNERDESIGSISATPDPVIEQALADLQAGQVDTDLRNSGGVDAAQRRALIGSAADQGAKGVPDGAAGGSAHPAASRDGVGAAAGVDTPAAGALGSGGTGRPRDSGGPRSGPRDTGSGAA